MTEPAASLRDRVSWWLDGKRYRWPHRVLFVAALPKSGSQWMKAMMLRIPGYHEAPLADPRGLLSQHHINREVLDSIPNQGYFTVNYPIEATADALNAIRALGLRVVVMWRDLRDQTVSRYYHVLNDPWHPSHERYRTISREHGVNDSVQVVLDQYTSWIQEWRDAIAQDPDQYHLVRYEDLMIDPRKTFNGVLSFYQIGLSSDLRNEIVESATSNTRAGSNLEERMKRGSTFRSGQTGEWRSHFSAENVTQFKNVAGNLLIELGYETDLNW